jgi:hypothetical protein
LQRTGFCLTETLAPHRLIGLADEMRRLALLAETSESRSALEELALRCIALAAGLDVRDAAAARARPLRGYAPAGAPALLEPADSLSVLEATHESSMPEPIVA